MKLAFYYHIPILRSGSDLMLPGYLGVFVDSLAQEVEKLVLVMHEDHATNSAADYVLTSKNIQLVNLGGKTATWNRVLNHKNILKNLQKGIDDCDFLLVRSPSPLAPYFSKYLTRTKVFFLVVGSYRESAKYLETKTLRSHIVKWFTMWLDQTFNRALRDKDVIVNSKELKNRYEGNVKSLSEVKTTTLSSADFFHREDTCQGDYINLLYTGRLDRAKGLFELLESFIQLRAEGHRMKLHYVGWENDPSKPIETALRKRAQEENLEEEVIFHGKKRIGEDLNAMYKMADIYLIPSYHEGFPRTIWESLAHSLPVIATSVGSIPYFLKNKESAILIKPKSIEEIVSSIKELINDKALRKNIISNGRDIALDATLETNSKKLINIMINEYQTNK